MAVLNRRLLLLLLLIRRRRRRRRERKCIWVRDIFKKRLQLGEYHSLINEMRLTDHQSFYRYFHMSPERFAHLLSLVGPAITRQTTSFRQPIHADERLAITLQYLVTGDSNFYNYKGTFSIILLAVCEAQYCFTLLDIGDIGRQSDGGVLALPCPKPLPGQSSSVPYYFVGDSAFPLKTYMLRPFPGRFLPEDKQIFNYRLSRARRVIENTFGRSIVANPDKVTKITQAACCLHNYLRISEINNPPSTKQPVVCRTTVEKPSQIR